MPFIDYTASQQEYVTPQHSTAYGALATGESIEVGYLSFTKGEGAEPHQHPHEQIVVVIRGRIRARLGDEERDLGPGSGFHVPPNVPHGVTALDDSEVLSCKNLVDGRGHRI
ncbi:cupin domain-containing protein [Phytoactinopolyspora halophila]|uniref:cupin domain-containing protein n=1 Tax=Phytoactinopolyspora halophila TaxID=1981511 RepID=UPI001B8C5520|nr:cupin domain-containing protein [Phytoactinopolyspora halophila]